MSQLLNSKELVKGEKSIQSNRFRNVRTLENFKNSGKFVNNHHDNEHLIFVGELFVQLSHNIRNPLQAFSATTDLLEVRNEEKLTKEDKEDIDKLKNTIRNISEQTQNIQNFLRQMTLQIEKISVLECIKNALSKTSYHNHIDFEITKEDVEIDADKKTLEIIFVNIITNAIEAIGDNPGKIKIKIRKENSDVFVDIENSGPKIKDRKKVFDALYSTKQGSNGLGMTSAKAIVKLHSGDILVKNNPTTFTAKIPITKNDITDMLNILGYEKITNSDSQVIDFLHKAKSKEHCVLLFQNKNLRNKIINEFFNKKHNQDSTKACFTHVPSKYECNKTISYQELVEDGKLSSDTIFDFFDKIYEKSKKRLRVACEDTAWFSEKGYFDMHQKISNNFDQKILDNSTILCCYDMSKLTNKQIAIVLKSREFIILEKPFAIYQKVQQ